MLSQDWRRSKDFHVLIFYIDHLRIISLHCKLEFLKGKNLENMPVNLNLTRNSFPTFWWFLSFDVFSTKFWFTWIEMPSSYKKKMSCLMSSWRKEGPFLLGNLFLWSRDKSSNITQGDAPFTEEVPHICSVASVIFVHLSVLKHLLCWQCTFQTLNRKCWGSLFMSCICSPLSRMKQYSKMKSTDHHIMRAIITRWCKYERH